MIYNNVLEAYEIDNNIDAILKELSEDLNSNLLEESTINIKDKISKIVSKVLEAIKELLKKIKNFFVKLKDKITNKNRMEKLVQIPSKITIYDIREFSKYDIKLHEILSDVVQLGEDFFDYYNDINSDEEVNEKKVREFIDKFENLRGSICDKDGTISLYSIRNFFKDYTENSHPKMLEISIYNEEDKEKFLTKFENVKKDIEEDLEKIKKSLEHFENNINSVFRNKIQKINDNNALPKLSRITTLLSLSLYDITDCYNYWINIYTNMKFIIIKEEI